MNPMAAPKLVRVEADRYSPVVSIESPSYITVRMSKSIHAPNVYWQLVDPEFSLLELGFDASCGRLVSCSVPLFNGEVRKYDSPLGSVGLPGTPIFEMAPWTSRAAAEDDRGTVLKSPGRIQLDQYPDALVIILKSGQIDKIVVLGEKLACRFGLDGRLHSLGLIGATAP